MYTSARSKYSSVNSGASSGSIQVDAPALLFFLMTVPHRDDVTRISSRGPNGDDHSSAEVSSRDESGFTVIESIICKHRVAIRENNCGIGEVEPALSQRPFVFG